MRLSMFLLVGAIGLAAAAGPLSAQETRYGAWAQADDGGEVRQLLDSLKGLIDEAERARAADPVFLKDLRDLVNRYENPWQTRLLFDDFRDGDFTRNPVWSVSAGQYVIETRGAYIGLRSSIAAAAAPAPTGGQQDLAGALLGALLQPRTTAQPGGAQFASIYTAVRISNAFALRLELSSKERAGRLDFGPYQGASGNLAYRLAYRPGARPGLQLLRLGPQGTAVIASYDQPLALEDGWPHVVDWTRDRAGAMTVAVDGRTVITASDLGLRDPFDGFLVINSGGSYAIRSIAVDGTK